jgi:hypothetical protein
MRLVELTIAYSTTTLDGVKVVGGKIDAAFIKRRGTLRWMARKEECPAQYNPPATHN